MLIAASAFILGILTAFYWPSPTLLLCLILFVLSVVILVRRWILNCVALLFLLLGFLWGDFYLQRYYNSLLPVEIEGSDILLRAQITELPVKLHKGWRLILKVQKSQPETQIKLLRVNWYTESISPQLGEIWSFNVRLKRPHGYANPSSFDYEQWMLSRGLHGRGYIRYADRLYSPRTSPLRQSLWDSLQSYPGDAGSLISALVLGEKHGLSYSQRQLFIDSGTAHLFAISGLHIGMVAGLLFVCSKLLILLALYMPALKQLQGLIYQATPLRIALTLSWLGCVAYAVLAGFSLSTQRALIMLSVVYLACALRQRIFSIHSFAIALMLVLLAQPAAVLGPGLFLSFSAVAWIAYILHVLPDQLANWKKGLLIQLLLPLCLWPIVQLYFGSSATLGAVANIVLIPLMSFVLLPLCLLASCLEFFVPLSNQWLLTSIDTIYQCVVIFLQQLNASTWAKPIAWQINITQVLLLQLAIALLLLPKGFPRSFKGISVFIAILCLLPQRQAIPEGDFKASVMDVGQGLSVLVQTQSHSLLFDTGPASPSGFSVSRAVLRPYLQAQDVNKLDILMLSHGDQDHRGGLTLLNKEIMVLRVMSGQPQRIQLHAEIKLCRAGQSWHWDGVDFEVLWPQQNRYAGALSSTGLWSHSNNHSCVLRISSPSQSLLLTGDIERAVEERLLSSNIELQADVLVAPHHGSNSSSSSPFIRAVSPVHAIFSAGYRSRFGHPHKKVVQRYEAASVKWYTTANCGQFIYAKSTTSCHRKLDPRRWQTKKRNN